MVRDVEKMLTYIYLKSKSQGRKFFDALDLDLKALFQNYRLCKMYVCHWVF